MVRTQYQDGGKQESWVMAEGCKGRKMEEKKEIGR